MREDEVSASEAAEIAKGPEEAESVLFALQRRIEADGKNPYATNV